MSENEGSIPEPSATARSVVSQVLVVVVHTTERTTRRRIYLSLKAAERAVSRAHTRGQDAEMVLARLVPEAGTATWREAVTNG